MLAQDGVEGLIDQGGFSASGETRYANQFSEREFEVYSFQVVSGGAGKYQLFSIPFASFGRYGDFFLPLRYKPVR